MEAFQKLVAQFPSFASQYAVDLISIMKEKFLYYIDKDEEQYTSTEPTPIN